MWCIRTTLASFAILLATAFSTFAGESPGTVTLTPFIGGYSFDGIEHVETAPVFGLRAGYLFTDHIGAEAFFDVALTDFTGHLPVNGHDVTMYRYGADLLYHFWPNSRLVLYVAAGYGGRTIDRDDWNNDTRGVFDYGLGVKYFLTDRIALRGDFRHLILHDNHTLYNYEYTAGLSFAFGGKTPAAAPGGVPAEKPIAAPVPEPEAPLEEVPPTEPTPEKMKYCMTLNIRFDIDMAEIRPQYHDEVAKVGDFMRKYPSTTAVIEGHADDVGTDEHNMELSKRRAETVVSYLVDRFGIERSRLTPRWYGKTRPIADNSTDEGKQKNRRINAIIDCAIDVKQIAPPPERLCMTLRIEFDSGSAEIRPRYHDEIAKVAEYMKKYPTTTALIEGHTDNVGGAEENMKLSQRRAESVVSYLVDKFGIDRARLGAKGYGDIRRIAYNTTPEGRQKNRRINAIIDCVTK
jgi:OOP family OmpA-OmpF porin